MVNKIALIISGGLGDSITYAARLQSLLTIEQVDKADFYVVDTYNNVTYMIADFLSLSPFVDEVNLNSIPFRYSYKKVIDWRPDNTPLRYLIEKGYKIPYSEEDKKWADDILKDAVNPIIIYPYTLGGNAWAKAEKYVRSPKEAWWEELFKDIKKCGGTPIVIGGEDEIIFWKTDDVVTAYIERGDFMRNIPLIYNSKGFIGINSWAWQVAHYIGNIDTCVVWLHNHFWIKIHVSDHREKLTIFEKIPDNQEIISKINILNGRSTL